MGELISRKSPRIHYDSVAVNSDAEVKTIPIKIMMIRNDSKMLVPYFIKWLPST